MSTPPRTLAERLAARPDFQQLVHDGRTVRELHAMAAFGLFSEATLKRARRHVVLGRFAPSGESAAGPPGTAGLAKDGTAREAVPGEPLPTGVPARPPDPAAPPRSGPVEATTAAAPPLFPERAPAYRAALQAAVADPPVEPPSPTETLRGLEQEVARLREQVQRLLFAGSTAPTGGRLTLLRSDLHVGDRSHMLRCAAAMEAHALALVERTRPDEIQIISAGDEVAGRGVYRDQHLDSVVQSTADQVRIAAYKLWQFDRRLREACPRARVTWRLLSGNHDRVLGENLAPYLAFTARALGVAAVYAGDEAVVNLAAEGTFLLHVEHGYGGGQQPSSERLIRDLQARLLRLGRCYFGERRIRRLVHGHTHYFSLGTERVLDLPFDVLGGCQRNDRIALGKNPRPLGWIAYHSPAGCATILDPIALQPDVETIETELADLLLPQRNMRDCGQALEGFQQLARELGLVEELLPEGR